MDKRNLNKLKAVIVKATEDSFFMQKLIESPKETLEKEGVIFSEPNVVIHINKANEMYLVIPKHLPKGDQALRRLPTHPSLPQISQWIMHQICHDGPYKKQLEEDPLKVLKKLKIRVPKDVKVHIVKNTHDTVNVVIPRTLKSSDELNDIELQAIAGGGKGGFNATVKPNVYGFSETSIRFTDCIFNLGNTHEE